MTKAEIIAAIKKLIKDNGIYYTLEENSMVDPDGEGTNVYFTVKTDTTLTYADLDNISAVFNTKSINMRSDTSGYGRGCSSCGYGGSSDGRAVYLDIKMKLEDLK